MSTTKSIHFLSINVQGLRDKMKRARLREWLSQQKADIAFLQETHFTSDMNLVLKDEFSDWNNYHSFGGSNCRGCSIFIKKQIDLNVIDTQVSDDGRYLFMNVDTEGNTYTLLNLYAPNNKNSRNSFFANMSTLLLNYSQGIKIVGGDFNETQNNNIDRKSRSISSQTSSHKVTNLSKLLKNNSLTDIWRQLHPEKTQFTWRRKNNVDKSRIDYWLVEHNLTPLILSTDIRPASVQYTDHLAISLKLKIPLKRGPGYWKLNNAYLNDSEYCNEVIDIIKECTILDFKNDMTKWELCKYEIKSMSISYAKKKSRERHSRLQTLEKQLKHLLEIQSPNDENNIQEIEAEINKIYDFKAHGAQIRSRIQVLEEGEKNTKYFLNLEKSRQNRKHVSSLIIDGNRTIDIDCILNEEVKFYKHLYRSSNTNYNTTNQYLNEIILENQLNSDDANMCEGPVTMEECITAINGMKANKSPGLDGLTVEFYQKFSKHLCPLLIKSFKSSFETGELTRSQKQSVFSLLFKKGNPEDLENWRPISLLNVDYKIIARILALRLQKILPKIINTDQQGFIKNRFIGNNIRQIQDIIDYAELLNIDGVILFLDFKKAFDTVEWIFMNQVLKKFGFKNDFTHWVKILYNNISASVINYGWISENFNIERGIKQGCPLSSLLFIIIAEILSTKIRSSKDINGICVNIGHDNKRSLKITQLADDTTLFLKNINEILPALKHIDEFGKHSGLRLNINKTNGLLIGRSKALQDNIIDNIKLESHVKALGTYFGVDKAACDKLNWENKIDACQKLLNTWSCRKLTFYGKITIIKTLFLPKIAYLTQSISTPKSVIDKLNTMMFKFLWSNKSEKIKRNTLIGPKHQGGLDMPDLLTYVKTLRLKWVKSLTDKSVANWKVLPNFWLKQYGSNFLIFNMNLDGTKSLPKVSYPLPQFYKEIVEAFIELNKCKGTNLKINSFYDVRKQVIWGNQKIKYKGKSLLFNNWIDAGIICIDDILCNGKISETLVYNKLTNKTNWISEMSILRASIPQSWKTFIYSEESIKTKIKKSLCIKIGNSEFKNLNNKEIKKILIGNKFIKPYITRYWEQDPNYRIHWESVYNFINNVILDNRIKQFKYKLLHRIIPTNENLFTWKIVNSPNCLHCNQKETLDHFFITCPYTTTFWTEITSIFKNIGIEKNLQNLHYIAIGYKTTSKEYQDINIILSYIGFSIYKSYFVGERRTNPVNITHIFRNEINMLLHYVEKHKLIILF